MDSHDLAHESPYSAHVEAQACKSDWSLILDPRCDGYEHNIKDKQDCKINKEKKYEKVKRKPYSSCEFETNQFDYYIQSPNHYQDCERTYHQKVESRSPCHSDRNRGSRKQKGRNQITVYKTQINEAPKDMSQSGKKYREPKSRRSSSHMESTSISSVSEILNKPNTPFQNKELSSEKEKMLGRFSLLDKIKDFVRGNPTENFADGTPSMVTLTFVADDDCIRRSQVDNNQKSRGFES